MMLAEGLIPGEIQDDAFGAVLRSLAAREDVRTILEVQMLQTVRGVSRRGGDRGRPI